MFRVSVAFNFWPFESQAETECGSQANDCLYAQVLNTHRHCTNMTNASYVAAKVKEQQITNISPEIVHARACEAIEKCPVEKFFF